jgi:3-isopropylmalate dehydrogenase
VHKQNVLRMSDGLFLKEARRIADANADITYDEQLIDSMTALLIRNPARYDVIVATNMFGDILSDEASELSGGLGLGASINAGEVHCMAQAQHGSAPHLAGTDKANPVSLMLSAAMLLDWLARRHTRDEYARAAKVISDSADVVLAKPETRTVDLGGSLGTSSFTKLLNHQITQSVSRP